MKTTKFLPILWILVDIFGTHSFIIPDELPSLLSLVYSNIPIIKKGTDSRVGWGFRLGNRADFQVLVELGPQKNTQPLGNEAGSTNNKRNVENSLSNELYAKQQERRKEISNSEGSKWMDQWSAGQSNVPQNINIPLGPKPGLAIGEIDAKSVIPEDSVFQLEELYEKMAKQKKKIAKESTSTTTTGKPKTTTPEEDALGNVALDD